MPSSTRCRREMVTRLNAITDPLKERLGRSFDYYEGPDNDRTR